MRTQAVIIRKSDFHIAYVQALRAVPPATCWSTPRLQNPTGNPLWEIFSAYNTGPLINKWFGAAFVPPLVHTCHRPAVLASLHARTVAQLRASSVIVLTTSV